MLKKTAAVAVIGLVAAAAVLISPTSGFTKAAFGGHKVTICHYPGHVGDFVTFNWMTIGTPACSADAGGNAIIVAPEACKNGHAAIERSARRRCDNGEDQAGAP